VCANGKINDKQNKVGSDLEENWRLTLTVGSTEESYIICQLGVRGQSYNSTLETNVAMMDEGLAV
jgi:hypothetical protein